MRTNVFMLASLFAGGLLPLAPSTATDPGSTRFEVIPLAVDANEGMAAADVDGDGDADLVAGRFWYRNPDWTPRPLRQIDDWNGYVESNGDYLFDVNDDGRPDVLAGSFMGTEVRWFENPGERGLRLGLLWPEHRLVDTGNQTNEGVLFEDLDGDGRPEWVVNSWQKDVPMFVWRLEPRADEANDSKGGAAEGGARYRLIPARLGPAGNGHGCGVGDLSGDGRPDVLVGQGWYEQPARDPWNEPWRFHPAWDLHASLPMLVVDVDGDGNNDIVYGNGHDYGLVWWQFVARGEDGGIRWKEHRIDGEYSQPHTLAWADLTGDGRPELITGKRYYAHNGKDPGGEEPPRLYYYSWDPASARFTRHTIDEGHVGTGLQIVVEDFNRDGRSDLAVAGKSGSYVLINRGAGS